jgi:glyoxylase-like metal-dependent hydrolase (beta-lactamase superfamily II)
VNEGSWIELGEGVYARRYDELDLTVGLVTGKTGCLVIDTRGDVEQGRELAAAIREITGQPWTVVYTHAHFDHCFGTTAFLPCAVWAQDGCLPELVTSGAGARKRRAAWYRAQGKPTIADALDRTNIELPDRLFTAAAELDLGDRKVALVHPGKAHTGHDVLVHVPDAGIVFGGDVVENAPSGFSADSFGVDNDLAGWPAALDGILALDASTIVPGHGAPVDRDFVAGQRDKLTELVSIHTAVHAGTLPEEDAVARSPYPSDVTLAALKAPATRRFEGP